MNGHGSTVLGIQITDNKRTIKWMQTILKIDLWNYFHPIKMILEIGQTGEVNAPLVPG